MRRRAAIGLIGTGALGAGVGAAWWRSQRAEAEPELRNLRFDKPGGGQFSFESVAGKPLVLNFWAPWCVPCVTEMPLLDRFYAQQHAKGWEVLALAIDQEAPVSAFVAKHALRLPVALGGADGLSLSWQLGNKAGGLPFTVVLRADGHVGERKLGLLDEALLQKWSVAFG
jgi:thiol-disulfide isomerase/thioredoxin